MKNKWKRLLLWLKDPHGWGLVPVYLLIFGVIAGGVCFLIFVPDRIGFEAIGYFLYPLMALSLAYGVYVAVKRIYGAYCSLAESNRFLNRFKYDYEWRTILLSTGSSVVAGCMAAYFGVLFRYSLSVWYATLAFYYFVLVATRGGVLISRRYGRKMKEDDLSIRLRDANCYFGCGMLLIVLTFAFAGMHLLTVIRDYHNEYAGATIYVAAAYAFWKISFAIYNLVKSGKREDLTVRSLRSINIADALVSIVALQAAMLETFSEEGVVIDISGFNAATGAITATLIICLGCFMAVSGRRHIRELTEEKKERQALEKQL